MYRVFVRLVRRQPHCFADSHRDRRTISPPFLRNQQVFAETAKRVSRYRCAREYLSPESMAPQRF